MHVCMHGCIDMWNLGENLKLIPLFAVLLVENKTSTPKPSPTAKPGNASTASTAAPGSTVSTPTKPGSTVPTSAATTPAVPGK